MSKLYICASAPLAIRLDRLFCPTCKKQRFFLIAHYECYGSDLTCLRCGEQFDTEEGRKARPFCPGWRKQNIKSAKKLWRRHNPHGGKE